MLKRLYRLAQIWLLFFVLCAGTVVLAFTHIDVPIAVRCANLGHVFDPLNMPLGAAVILSLESAVTLSLLLARVVRGHISRLGETLGIACLASICAYGINDIVFKPFFGVPAPAEVIAGARHTFNLLMGSEQSSFPSGHMVLAGAFAGVFMRLYRASLWPLSALLLLAAVLLVIGDWHFVSDAIAGTYIGVLAGIMAGEAWAVHSSKNRPAG